MSKVCLTCKICQNQPNFDFFSMIFFIWTFAHLDLALKWLNWFLQRSYRGSHMQEGKYDVKQHAWSLCHFPFVRRNYLRHYIYIYLLSRLVVAWRSAAQNCFSKGYANMQTEQINIDKNNRKKRKALQYRWVCFTFLWHFWFKFHISRFLCNQSVKEETDREYVFTNFDNLTQILWT